MNVETSTENKIVEEYEITTVAGLVMPVTVDPIAGDTFTEDDDRFTIYLSPKPSIHDSNKKLPAENITIYKMHIVSTTHRIREVPRLTPEQTYQFQKTLQELTNKSVH